jgi:hypothetical protein
LEGLSTSTLVLGALGALGGGVVGALARRALRGSQPTAAGESASASVEAERLRALALLERDAAIRDAEITAREEALVMRAAADAQVEADEERLVRVTA